MLQWRERYYILEPYYLLLNSSQEFWIVNYVIMLHLMAIFRWWWTLLIQILKVQGKRAAQLEIPLTNFKNEILHASKNLSLYLSSKRSKLNSIHEDIIAYLKLFECICLLWKIQSYSLVETLLQINVSALLSHSSKTFIKNTTVLQLIAQGWHISTWEGL